MVSLWFKMHHKKGSYTSKIHVFWKWYRPTGAPHVLEKFEATLSNICEVPGKHNFHHWVSKSPRKLHQSYLYSHKVVFWCAVTVILARYCEMLAIFLHPKIEEEHDTQALWLQQDGAITLMPAVQANFCKALSRSPDFFDKHHKKTVLYACAF